MTNSTDAKSREETLQTMLSGIRSGHIKAFCAVAITDDPGTNEFYASTVGEEESKINSEHLNKIITSRTVRLIGMLEIIKSEMMSQIGTCGDIDSSRKPKVIE